LPPFCDGLLSGVVPAKIAASFTPGELAALSVIGRQCQRHQACSLPIDAVAAQAGVCRTTVQNALRQARKLGLILVRERRVPGRPSGTNVIRIIDPSWSGWLKLAAPKLSGQGVGFKLLSPTNSHAFSSKAQGARDRLHRGIRGARRDPQPA
jgi:hypothetical protein